MFELQKDSNLYVFIKVTVYSMQSLESSDPMFRVETVTVTIPSYQTLVSIAVLFFSLSKIGRL